MLHPSLVLMPTMVSRLPKFGSRSKHPLPPVTPGAARLTNGFYHHPGPTGADGPHGPASSKQNGVCVNGTGTSATKAHQDFGKPAASDAKSRGSSSKPLPGGGAKLTQRSLKAPQISVRPLRPSSGSGHPTNPLLQKKTPAARSFSSEGIGSAPFDNNDLIRSRSLTQVRPPPTYSNPVPRSKAQCSAPVLPSTYKKPLLSSFGSASKPSGVSYKLSRPSLLRQPRPLRATSTNEKRNSLETLPTSENSPDASPEALPTSHDHMPNVVETLQEVCLSSVDTTDDLGCSRFSSKNDDDDSGLDQSGSRIDRLSVNEAAETSLSFLEDWTIMGCRGDHGEQRLACQNQSDQEQGGSSLDLSPSDSCGSGGTFLWDEEGLQPLGGVATSISHGHSHHIGSFDSDISGSDFLSNLESCDLDDDDLMLDGDLLEETSLSGSHRLSLSSQWKNQLCWEQHRSPDGPGVTGVNGLGLDVEELAEDCSAVRCQLEFLQTFLQHDRDDQCSSDKDVTSQSPDSQLQVLLQEVLQLREDLRCRDRTIAQLSVQLTLSPATTKCRCQETTGRTNQCTQTSVKERESVASQTPWTGPKAPPLPPPAALLSPSWQYQRSRPLRARPRPSKLPHRATIITDIWLRPSGLTETQGATSSRKTLPSLQTSIGSG
ncbi:serine-rich coiled-coil domain-containing protein 2-like isoform X2 [Gouania willdenowi]|uniref:Serine-rich coiled-coil domain-containing protein 2-like n=1 Tax=Gouania willdenowi TaxID=441366 RepID=A0A8C5GCT8_GOUWI|nr:serine-rich coiled-coil domain-containing protein 2-like isoform X2 [Gouania willdenowi]